MKGEPFDCISGCNSSFTDNNGDKISGRGACKGNCWVDTAVSVLEAVATIAEKLT